MTSSKALFIIVLVSSLFSKANFLLISPTLSFVNLDKTANFLKSNLFYQFKIINELYKHNYSS